MNSNDSSVRPLLRPKLVTIAVPIYKRLEYLPSILKMVGSQDYPDVELIVSDNGMNGSKVRELVETHYTRPYRFRQNPETVPMVPHFNQLLQEANGEYFVLLLDDDEITSNYASELVRQMERYPRATIAFSSQEVVDLAGKVLKRSAETLPDHLSGAEFIVAMWRRYEFDFKSVSTFLAKTEKMREVGGFPHFTAGTHEDDVMVVQLALGNDVVFAPKCIWRNRLYETSFGMSISIQDLAAATVEFIKFLDSDRTIQAYATANPTQWISLKSCLVQMAWQTYLFRWRDMYRARMSYWQWTRAAFAMPLIPAYYKQAARFFVADWKRTIKAWLGFRASNVKPDRSCAG